MPNLHCIPAFLIANPIMILILTIIKKFPPLEAPRFSVVGESTARISAWFDILSIMFISPVSIGGFGAGVSESHVSTHSPYLFLLQSQVTLLVNRQGEGLCTCVSRVMRSRFLRVTSASRDLQEALEHVSH